MTEFAQNLTEKMLTYALGRGLERFDRRTVTGLREKWAGDDYRFQTLIFEVVKSLPFQTKRAEYKKQEVAKK